MDILEDAYTTYDSKDLGRKYYDITEKIIGCAMRVHTTLGNGFQEVIYARCLAIELELAGLGFAREVEQTIFYRDRAVGTRRVDFLVEDKILVEIKAQVELLDVHLNQAMNYTEAFKLEIGLLNNFGANRLQFKRVHNNKLP